MRGDTPPTFEIQKTVPHQISVTVPVTVKRQLLLMIVGLWQDNGMHLRWNCQTPDRIGITDFVGQRLPATVLTISASEIANLPHCLRLTRILPSIPRVSAAWCSLAFSPPFCMTHAFITSFGFHSIGMNLDMGGIYHQPFHVFSSRENEHRFRPDAFASGQVFCDQVPLVVGERFVSSVDREMLDEGRIIFYLTDCDYAILV